MELVKEMLEPQIVEQETVKMLPLQVIQRLFVRPTKLVVSQLVEVVWLHSVHVQVIQVLQLVVLD